MNLIVQSWAEAHVILVHLYEFYGPFLHGYKIRIIDWSSIKHLGTWGSGCRQTGASTYGCILDEIWIINWHLEYLPTGIVFKCIVHERIQSICIFSTQLIGRESILLDVFNKCFNVHLLRMFINAKMASPAGQLAAQFIGADHSH